MSYIIKRSSILPSNFIIPASLSKRYSRKWYSDFEKAKSENNQQLFYIGLAKKFVWLVNILFNKILHENEKCLYFYLKLNEFLANPIGYLRELTQLKCKNGDIFIDRSIFQSCCLDCRLQALEAAVFFLKALGPSENTVRTLIFY